jgi:diguanylate cyclase (GGDEF)-like protein/PAS domain S-box-containing protein
MDNIKLNHGECDANTWYHALFEANPLPMYIYDADTLRFMAVNAAALAHYGYSREEFLSMATTDLRPVEDIPALLAEISEIRIAGHAGFHKSPVRRHRKKDGSIIYVESAKELLTLNNRQAICVLVNDVTERVWARNRIEILAFYDELTGLPNRAQLRRDLQEAIVQLEKEGREGGSLVLAIVELVRFREINYTLGFAIGDELLKRVGQRIRQCAGTDAAVARLGNVQFGVFWSDTGGADTRRQVKRLIGPLLNAVKEPITVGEIDYELGVHAGVALYPAHGAEPQALFRYADIALFHARRTGKDCMIYDPAQDPYKPQRLAMLSEFRKAIKGGQLQLYCQPKVEIRTGQIVSAESLVRWSHPTHGLIAPDEFIPLVEPTELIHPLTQWMLEASMSQCHAWRKKGLGVSLAVNLSTRNLLDPTLPESIGRLIEKWGGGTQCVGLEITESSIIADPSIAVEVLEQLHQMGCKLYLDDFGTGYSSFSYLMNLPIDAIKIDHSFTMHMIEDPHAATIVKSTIEMAHGMGMLVVAEGAANREIWEALADLDCDEAQGAYISMPMRAADLPQWLAH